MTRRPAADRFRELDMPAPDEAIAGDTLASAVRALTHPRRRKLLDLLTVRGPASVGQLARWSGLAVGSVSYHTRVLAEGGFIEPAPELAGDTRESWWRSVHRTLTWGDGTFVEGTAGAELVRVASTANLDYLLAEIRAWQRRRAAESWSSSVIDSHLVATQEQINELSSRLSVLMAEWEQDCREHPGEAGSTRGVRAIAIVFPDADGPRHA